MSVQVEVKVFLEHPSGLKSHCGKAAQECQTCGVQCLPVWACSACYPSLSACGSHAMTLPDRPHRFRAECEGGI